jgi:hypothetical protein
MIGRSIKRANAYAQSLMQQGAVKSHRPGDIGPPAIFRSESPISSTKLKVSNFEL